MLPLTQLNHTPLSKQWCLNNSMEQRQSSESTLLSLCVLTLRSTRTHLKTHKQWILNEAHSLCVSLCICSNMLSEGWIELAARNKIYSTWNALAFILWLFFWTCSPNSFLHLVMNGFQLGKAFPRNGATPLTPKHNRACLRLRPCIRAITPADWKRVISGFVNTLNLLDTKGLNRFKVWTERWYACR